MGVMQHHGHPHRETPAMLPSLLPLLPPALPPLPFFWLSQSLLLLPLPLPLLLLLTTLALAAGEDGREGGQGEARSLLLCMGAYYMTNF